MTAAEDVFAGAVGAIFDRYLAQNGNPVPPKEEVAKIAAGMWSLVKERGLPRALAPSERGTPGEMSESEVAALLDRVLGGVVPERRAPFTGPVRQLVKACFYPEFKTCRDSFREVSPDGSCRRQELARALGRVSGSHCVDCPHWVALTPEQHARYLAREWRTSAADFEAHQDVFLPEDFRALRVFLHQQARTG